MKLIYVLLSYGIINEGLLVISLKQTISFSNLGIDPARQPRRRNSKADAEVHLFGQITINTEQPGRLSVNISSFVEESDQTFVIGQMSQNVLQEVPHTAKLKYGSGTSRF